MLKFVVMSDLHLAPEGGLSNGLDTAERLSRAVASINRNHADADFCILAGDLADRGEADAYRRLQAVTAPLVVPLHITLGNHDDRPTFLSIYGSDFADDTGHIQKVIDTKGYRIIVLDSSEPGIVSGVLCEKRLAWLREKLAEAKDRPVIVVLHHHANNLHMPVDEIKLQRDTDFMDVLEMHPDVRQVIAGHVHITTTGFVRGIPFTTIAGNHYNVSAHLPGMPGEQARLDGPGQYAVVLADDDSVLVHFHNYIDHHAEMADHHFP